MTALALCAPWVDAETLFPDGDCTPCAKVTDATDPERVDAAVLEASEWLWRMSGHRYPGICTTTVRPCVDRCGCTALPWGPLAPASGWPLGCGCGDGSISTCCGPVGITLGVSPVVEVTEVRLNGAAFDDFELVGDVLARADGERWPACQDLTDPDFEVDVTWGVAPPGLGERAARDLACVLVSADCGDESCQEPANVVRQTGGGMTIEVQSPVGDPVAALPQSVRLFLQPFDPRFGSPPVVRRPKVGHRIRSTAGRGCRGC